MGEQAAVQKVAIAMGIMMVVLIWHNYIGRILESLNIS